MSNPTTPPSSSSTPPPAASSPTPSPTTPPTPWWKNSVVLGVAGLVGAIAAVLALFRDTVDFKIASTTDSPTTSIASTANPAPGPGVGSNNYGWGPMREMYTTREPSPTAVFNSIVDNKQIGDQRNYVQCRVADSKNMLADEVAISGDVEILVYVLIDNSSALPDQAIRGARMDLLVDNKPVFNPVLNVTLSADNAVTVWNGCKILSTKPTTLSYVPGSAHLAIAENPNIKVDDRVVRGDKLLPGVRGNADGVIGGDNHNYGWIEFRVKAFGRG